MSGPGGAPTRRNRVDPFGDLHAVARRGTFTGNRGCLVDDDGSGPANTDLVAGNGLRGLTERARESRARVIVSASPLGGYRLLVTRDR